MAWFREGKFLILCLLLLLFDFPRIPVVYANSAVVIATDEHDNTDDKRYSDALTLLNQHQLQLEKLEELVRNLSELVSRLESRVLDNPKIESLNDAKLSGDIAIQEKRIVGTRESAEPGNVEGKVLDGDKLRAMSVTKYSPFWSERFQFVSAVKLESVATCIDVLPIRDYEGLSKYVAVGDDKGRVYLFLRNGDVLLEFDTLSDSPVTAMVSFLSVHKNESVVVTGHENGMVLGHKVWETSNGEEWTSLHGETTGKFASSEPEGVSSVTILEVHHVGRKRYILAANAHGKIRVFRENGAIYGLAVPTSRPLAFLKQRLLFLTETGAGSLDLRTMKLRESECEGLNRSVSQYYVFDATERSKAYGFTSDGDLIHVFLLGDIMNFKCRVRSKRKFDMAEPLAFHTIKGYLLVVNQERAFVYNVSSQNYVRAGGPRLLFSAGLDEIMASFLNYRAVDADVVNRRVPLIAGDREKLVVLSLGNGYVGMYRSNLPVFKGEFNTMLWTSPVLFFILFLFGAWQFFANKKEALTSWGPDDPFSSTAVTSAAPLGSSSGDRSFTDNSRNGDRSFTDNSRNGDRSFADSSRNADIMDLRGGGLRGPSRRYSPPRYSGASTSSFRPSSADTNPRPAPADPSFRMTSELKFRGSNLEPPGFPKRRDIQFVNSQVVDDSK